MAGGTDVIRYCSFSHSLHFLVVVEVLLSDGLVTCVDFMKGPGVVRWGSVEQKFLAVAPVLWSSLYPTTS